ncbi:MAG: hypothetical protein KF685_00930 [Acidobacteria bacterium]|nr:hypothetical protein [Acidobacteriota bacterium]
MMENPSLNENGTAQPAKSKKWIFVIIAVCILVLFGAFVIVVATIGIYLYTTPSPRPFERPANLRTNSPSKTENKDPIKNTNGTPTDNLVGAIRKRSKVGGFDLQNVVPNTSTPTFTDTIGEAKGIYVSGGRTITFTVAEYKTKAQAAVYLTRLLRERAEKGAKILDKVRVSQKGVNGSFQDDKQTYYGFCTWPDNKATLCHLIAGDDAASVLEFRQALQP